MKTCLMKLGLIALLSLSSLGPRAETLSLVADEWPPYVDESLPHGGLAIDLVTAAFARAGYGTQFSRQDWNHALEGARIGVYDVVANIWQTPERARDLDFSEAYLVNDIRFIKRKSSPFTYERVDDLQGLLVGVVKGYAYPQEFADYPAVAKIVHPALLPALNGLVQGKYDLVVGDKQVIDYTLRQFLPNEAKDLEFLDKSVGQSPLHIAVSRSNPKHGKIVEDFNRAMREMREDGTYQSILSAHQSQP